MKYIINNKFKLKDIAGEKIIIAKGAATIDFGAVIVPNETGIFLWNCLEVPSAKEELAQKLAEKYGISAEQAENDVDTFIEKAVSEGIIVNTEE